MPGGRFRTCPSTRTTHSERRVSAVLKAGQIRVGHALGDAVMVAEIDEQHAAMIADAVAPAGEAHDLTDLALAQFSTGMRAVAVHFPLGLEAGAGGPARSARTTACEAGPVKARPLAGLTPFHYVTPP